MDPAELVLEMMAADPTALFMAHINNYADGDAEALRTMLTHPATALGLADGGAHVAIICDASMPTTMLTHWTRIARGASAFRSSSWCRARPGTPPGCTG